MCGATDCEQGTGRRLRNLVVDDLTPLQAAAWSTQTGFRQTQLIADEQSIYDPRDHNGRLLLGINSRGS